MSRSGPALVVPIIGHALWVVPLLCLAVAAGVAIGETPISLPVIGQVLANKLWQAGHALAGALFLIAADVLSRTLIKGQVLPIGVITALVGAQCSPSS
jgi:ABC-type Fe3+-siderophore transport system permease subunit